MIGRVQRTKGLPSTFSHCSERGSSGFHSYNNACASFSDYALFSAPYSILLHYLKRKIRVKSHCLMQPFSKSVSDRDCSRNQAGEKGVWEVKATITHLCHLPNEQQEPPNCCICFFFSLQPSILLNKIDPVFSVTVPCLFYLRPSSLLGSAKISFTVRENVHILTISHWTNEHPGNHLKRLYFVYSIW